MINVLPDADLFSLLDFLPDSDRAFLKGKKVRSHFFLAALPGVRRFYRNYLPLMPLAVESLDLSGYQMILSSWYAVAKGVLHGARSSCIFAIVIHRSVMRGTCRSNTLRYSMRQNGLKGVVARVLLHYMRLWDCRLR
jgi:hypothetical protein